MPRSRGKPARMRVWHPRAHALRKKTPPLHRRARACPSPCCDRGGQAPALRKKRSRSGAGAPELQRWARCLPVGETSRAGGLAYGGIETRRSLLPGSHQDMKHPQLRLITIRVFVNPLPFAVGVGIGTARGAGNRIDRFIRLEPQIQFL